jgi:hypothetical protein
LTLTALDLRIRFDWAAFGEDDVAAIRTEHLMTVAFLIGGIQTIGATPNGDRRVGLMAPFRANDARDCSARRIGLDAA